MKKLFIIGLFLITIIALGVSAADLTVTVGPTTIDTKPKATFTTYFDVSGATQNLTGLTVSQLGLNNFGLNYTVSGVPVPFNLNMGETKRVTVSGTVPKDVNTRQSPFLGTLTLSGGGITPNQISLSINAKSQLDLENVKFVVDGTSKSIDDGGTRKDVLPGSKVEIKGDVRNLFTDSDGITIEDVTVTVTIEGIDDDEDMEEDADVGDIDADEKEGFKVTFQIPEDVEEEEYDVTIEVEGDDENGASHFVKWGNILKVEKESDDIRVWKLSVSPSKISCNRKINVDVKLKNQGSNDQDEIVLQIINDDLGIDVTDNTIPELAEGTGEDTEYSKTYTFTIDDKVKAGTYPITIKSYYNTDEPSDSKTIDLIVEKCEAVEEETPVESQGAVVVVSPPEETTEETTEEEPEIITTPVTETTEGSLLGSNTYLMVLIGAVGVAVIVIIIMIVVLFSMKRKQ